MVCLLYFLIPASQLRLRNLMLLAASYYFYMNWEPAYALLLLTSTVATYAATNREENMLGSQSGAESVNLVPVQVFQFHCNEH